MTHFPPQQALHETTSEEFHPRTLESLWSMPILILKLHLSEGIFVRLGRGCLCSFRKQDPAQKADIESKVEYAFEAPERSFESVLLKGTQEAGLRRYALVLVGDGEWPSHLAVKTPTESMPLAELRDALSGYLGWSKGAGGAADLLGECTLEEMPEFIVQTLSAIRRL